MKRNSLWIYLSGGLLAVALHIPCAAQMGEQPKVKPIYQHNTRRLQWAKLALWQARPSASRFMWRH